MVRQLLVGYHLSRRFTAVSPFSALEANVNRGRVLIRETIISRWVSESIFMACAVRYRGISER